MKVDKNLEPRLKNVEKTLAGAVQQISIITEKIDVLSKAGGLDPKTLSDLSLLASTINDVKIEVDALSSRMNNFSKELEKVSDIGIKKVSETITKDIGDMASNIDTSITNATTSIQQGGEKLKKAYEQLLSSVNTEIDEESIDIGKIFKFSEEDDINEEFNKVKKKLQEDLNELANSAKKYNELKIGGASEEELTKAAKAQVNALNKLKKSFSAFYNSDDLTERATEDITKEMSSTVNEITKLFPSLKGEVYRTFEEIYDFIEAITENISNDFTASLDRIKASLNSVASETKEPTKKATTNAKTKAKVVEKTASSDITADVNIKEGVQAELIAELKAVITDLQKYVDNHPIELNAIINPSWGTKQTQKYLKSIREQLSKSKGGIDENLAARIYGLQDAFGKDFSDALNRSIAKLKDSLNKEGFSVGKLKIEDSAVKDLRDQITQELGEITVDINANILGTTVVDKDKSEAINKQFEELRALDNYDPYKIMDLVKAIKESGVDLDYSDMYKDRLKRIIKGLVDGIYGSAPEAIKKTRYPNGANPLIGEFNDNSAKIKKYAAKINAGATGDSLKLYKSQLELLLERQKTILTKLSQNVEGLPEATEEVIKDASQKIDAATIDIETATINIVNGNINNSDKNIKNNSVAGDVDQSTTNTIKETSDIVENTIKEATEKAEATLVATRDELVKAANQRFKELANSENVDFKGIESLVSCKKHQS